MNYQNKNLRNNTIIFSVLLTSGILFISYLLICARELNSFSKLIDDKVELETKIASSLIQQNYGLGNVVELRRTLQTLSESLNHRTAVFKNDTGEVLWEYLPGEADKAAVPRKFLNKRLLPVVLRLAKRPYHEVRISGELVSCGIDVKFTNGTVLGYFLWTFSIDKDADAVIQRLFVVFMTFLFVTLFLTAFVYYISDRILKPLPELTEKIQHEFMQIGIEYKSIRSSDISFISDSFDDLMRGWKASQEKLLKGPKLAAIGQTTSLLAHDVRKPFAMLKSMLSILDVLKSNPSELGRAKSDVNKAIKHVESMLSDIMDFSREIKLERNPHGLGNILDFSIRQASQGFVSSDIAFCYDIQSKWKPLVDEERIGRVFSNIISNAIEAITIIGKRTSGVITVASRDTRVNNIPYVEITIGNDGPVFQQMDIPKLFESFFTKGKQKGTGLGLASVRKIVDLHDGEVTARNRVADTGVEFQLRLPASPEKEQPGGSLLPGNIKEILFDQRKQDDVNIDSAVSLLAQSGQAIKMLILEDEALYRASVRNTINTHEGLHHLLTLYEAKTVADALKLIDKEGILYAIVDIDLGEVKNGFDFLAEIKDKFPKVSAMVHSNRTMKEDIDKAAALGAKVFVPKPLAIENLVSFLTASLPAPEGQRGRVIFACDDDALSRRCMGIALHAAGTDAEVYVFPNAEDLLAKFREMLKENRKAAYTVFTDQNMGQMSGLDLTAEIRKLNVPCRIYMISNEPRSDFESKALSAGADGYFEGPLDAEILGQVRL